MITEDFVSFETAKLLKEKGFDEKCNSVWRFTSNSPKGKGKWILYNYEMADEDSIWNPTLQMAMKWLREVHNFHIEVYRTACGYLYIISKVPTGSDLYDNGDAYDGDDENSGQWTTNEKACEAAIKYCLENLI